jgi:hypothetical protein
MLALWYALPVHPRYHALTSRKTRCGICLRGNTFSTEMTRMEKDIRPERILQNSWAFWGHRLYICFSVENEAKSFFPMMVNIPSFGSMPFANVYEYNFLGTWKQDIEIPTGVSLETSEEFLEGRNKEMFIAFMREMLQWRPEDRMTAKDMLQHPWLNDQIE